MSGMDGRDSWPTAGTSTSASSTSPVPVSTRHRPPSQDAAVTSTP